jgi:hypothetical protein
VKVPFRYFSRVSLASEATAACGTVLSQSLSPAVTLLPHYAALSYCSLRHCPVASSNLAALSCTSRSSKYKLLEVSVLLQYHVAIRRVEETTIYRNVGIHISSDAVPYPNEDVSQPHQYKNFNNSEIWLIKKSVQFCEVL